MSDHALDSLAVMIVGPLALMLGTVLIMGVGMAILGWYERACRERGICPRCGGRDHA